MTPSLAVALAASEVAEDRWSAWDSFLSLIAFIVFVVGLVYLVRGRFKAAVGCWIAAALIGPVGISLFT